MEGLSSTMYRPIVVTSRACCTMKAASLFAVRMVDSLEAATAIVLQILNATFWFGRIYSSKLIPDKSDHTQIRGGRHPESEVSLIRILQALLDNRRRWPGILSCR